jgi:methylmalonyl-CoA mutase cobalamin-binding subunit
VRDFAALTLLWYVSVAVKWVLGQQAEGDVRIVGISSQAAGHRYDVFAERTALAI